MSRSLIALTNNSSSTVSVQNPDSPHTLDHIIILPGASSIVPNTSAFQAASIGDPAPSVHNTGYLKIITGKGAANVFFKKTSKHDITAEIVSGDHGDISFSNPATSHGDPLYHGILITVSA